ncbi:cadherin repeat domain-containing protein, partial [Vibrio sinensis]
MSKAILTANTIVVIGNDGQLREVQPGEVPVAGEVVVVVGDNATAVTDMQANIVSGNDGLVELNLDRSIADIVQQIEQGQDPTVDAENAPGADVIDGSSPTVTGSISRTDAQTLATTLFETNGLESQGLSQTQSVALLDLIRDGLLGNIGDGGNLGGSGGGDEGNGGSGGGDGGGSSNEPPFFDFPSDQNSYSFDYDENSSGDDVIGTVSATDPEGEEILYSIEFGDDDPLEGLFEINADGEITLTEAGVDAFTNDYELQSNTHQITVVASDGVNTTETTVTLNEQDVNEAPVFELPDGGGDDYIFYYDENSADEYVIGTVSATDPENETVTYQLDFADDDPLMGLFEIDSNGQISLTAAGVAAFTNDYELQSNSHQVTVIASDGVNESSIVVTLNEQDVNEAPVFELPDGEEEYCFHYDENSAEEYVIGMVSALDPEGGNVTYSIDYAPNDPLNGLFEVNNNGQISLTDAGVEAFTNDYELFSNNHYITVVASDGVNE